MFMETTYFILGALSVVTLVMVVSVVRIFSSVSTLRENVVQLQRSLDDEIRGTNREFKDNIKDVELSIQEVYRRIDDTERGLTSSIDSRYDKLLNVVKDKNLVNTK